MMAGKKEIKLVPTEEQPYEIPENWCWTYLGNLVSASKERTEDFSDPSTRYVGLEHMEKDAGIVGYSSATEVKSLKSVFHKVQILYGKLRPYLNKHDVATFDGVCSTDILVFDPSKAVFPEYINLFLSQRNFIEYAVANSKGINLPRVSESIVSDAPCPLAPLAEQKRIVDTIVDLFADLDKAAENAERIVEDYENRKSAILHQAFTGELTTRWREENGLGMDSWKNHQFAELCNIVRGGSPRPAGNPLYYDGDIPFMKVADITGNNSPYVSSTEHTIKEAGLKKTRMVPPNTLLLTNSGATLGVPAICTIQTTFNDGIAAFLDLEPKSILFCYYFWMSKTKELRAIDQGAAQPNLNTKIIGEVEINLPTLAEQQEIVRILDELLGNEQRIKEAAEEMLDKIAMMKKSILADAFRGKLGTNDPADEPATELLRQILA